MSQYGAALARLKELEELSIEETSRYYPPSVKSKLDAAFSNDQNPDRASREELAQTLGLTEKQIRTYMSNKRARQ